LWPGVANYEFVKKSDGTVFDIWFICSISGFIMANGLCVYTPLNTDPLPL